MSSGAAFDWIVTLAGAAGGAGIGIICVCALVVRASRRLREPPLCDVIVVAPHPDDCLVLAGEYAIECVANGHGVTVVYATCGDADPGSPRAAKRRAEAVRVWETLGVKSDRLVFLERKQAGSEAGGGWTSDDREFVRDRLRRLFEDAAVAATVVVPAACESHVDHRGARNEALAALSSSRRGDLVAFECAEYNNFYDAVWNPSKAFSYVAGNLPLGGALRRLLPAAPPAGFVRSSATHAFPDDAARRARKRELMKLFDSEHNEKLDRLARQPELYRAMPAAEIGGTSPRDGAPRGYLQVRGRYLHASVVMLWTCVDLVLFGVAALAAAEAITLVGVGPIARGAAAALGLALLIRAWARRFALERAFALASIAAGIVLASVA